jgi:hypothetical protein
MGLADGFGAPAKPAHRRMDGQHSVGARRLREGRVQAAQAVGVEADGEGDGLVPGVHEPGRSQVRQAPLPVEGVVGAATLAGRRAAQAVGAEVARGLVKRIGPVVVAEHVPPHGPGAARPEQPANTIERRLGLDPVERRGGHGEIERPVRQVGVLERFFADLEGSGVAERRDQVRGQGRVRLEGDERTRAEGEEARGGQPGAGADLQRAGPFAQATPLDQELVHPVGIRWPGRGQPIRVEPEQHPPLVPVEAHVPGAGYSPSPADSSPVIRPATMPPATQPLRLPEPE